MWVTHNNYEGAPEFGADAYAEVDYPGVAFSVLGWETEPDLDTCWTGEERRTGRLVVRMIGDNRNFSCEPDELAPLDRAEYCGGCGQIGCCADGRDAG